MDIGELVGRGRTSDVYAFGSDSVVKVPHPDVPADWTRFEADLTRAVRAEDVPAPAVRDVIEIQGRETVVFERIEGPSMWQQMVADPRDIPRLAIDLAAIQRSVHEVGLPAGVPDFVDRLTRRIQLATALTLEERAEAIRRAQHLPRGAALLHGDLHPGNVLMGSGGPVVIDWFDVSIGHPVADIVRSSILMHANRGAQPQHLPGATPDMLRQLHRTDLDEFSPSLADIAPWAAVLAAGRLAEHAEDDEGDLLAFWAARDQTTQPDAQ